VSDPPATEAAASATDPASSAPASYGVSESEARIRVEATAPSWIQVRGPNNEQIFTRLLNTGERYLVPNREGLTLLTGNAGGVRIVVDGQALPALGASGEVKRGIVLDPERLKTAMTEQQG
jgi:cytoskeleton protein RodZ